MNIPLTWMAVGAVTTFVNGVAFALIAWQERDRALALWACAWIIWTPVVFIAGACSSEEHPYRIFVALTLDLVSALLFVAGTYAFVFRKVPKSWYLMTAAALVSSLTAQATLGGMAGLIPMVVAHALGLVTGGILLIRTNRDQTGAWMAGGCLSLVGLHLLDYPFFASRPELMPWGFILAMGLEVGAALGMLMLHFGNARMRLLLAQRLTEENKRSQALGRVAGGVAHDFNNLLTVMQGSLDIARSFPGDSAKSSQALEAIEQAVLQASRLTSRLLTFGRRAPVRVEAVDVEEIISNTMVLLRRVIPARISLENTLRPGDYVGLMDRVLLEQMILNLVTNARDAIPGNGMIRLESEIVDGPEARLILRITDTGEGISDEEMGQIFEPFFTTKSAGEGTGLGLASVQGATSQLGGTIRVESKLGEGTSFEVNLPFERATLAEQHSEVLPALKSLSIVVVDDEPQVRDITSRMLRAAGHTVVECPGADAAIEELERDPHDLLVSDIVMPNMSGVELVSIAKRLQPRIAILLISGYTDDELPQDPNIRYLSKPFDRKALTKAIGETMRRSVVEDQSALPE
jgi:signal transduction histidine kinase/ActR/RegA family two-component response regulator